MRCPDARERAGPVFPPPPHTCGGGGNTGPARSRASGQIYAYIEECPLKRYVLHGHTPLAEISSLA